MRPVLFLSKLLSEEEKGYGSTELETAALVWSLKKLSHYLDHAHIDIATDHSAIRDTSQSVGSGKPKGSYRLVNWRFYPQGWKKQIMIRHRAGRNHQNADALSRMRNVDDPEDAEAPVEVAYVIRKVDRTWGRGANRRG